MLGRRQLRAKAMQALYAYHRGNCDFNLIDKNMVKGVNDVEKLYFYLLNLLVAIKDEAEKKIDIGLNKNFPTEEEANPKRKFVENPIFLILENHPELKEFREVHKELSWNVEDVYPSKILNEFIETDLYKKYLYEKETDFDGHKELIIKLYSEFVAPNDSLYEHIEALSLLWADDLHIANTMVLNTIKMFSENDTPKLFTLLLDEEHLDFTRELLRETIQNDEETSKIIDEKAKNWDVERIALLDRILLQMAITEFIYFPSIPTKVTINEYVELSKVYSTPNSKVFINGILDKAQKDLQEQGKIRKSARGLI